MTDRRNIKIQPDAHERHNERRKAMGLTWEQYIDGQAPELPELDYDEVERRCRAAIEDAL